MYRFHSLFAFLLFVSLLPAMCGCQAEVDPFLDLVDAQSDVIEINDVERAIGLASSEQAFDLREFEEKTVSGLNRWVTKLEDSKKDASQIADDWKVSESVRPLMETFSALPVVSRFDQVSFVTTDAYFLRQNRWMDVLTNRIVASNNLSGFELLRLAADDFVPTGKPEKDLEAIVAALHPQVASEHLPSLVNAIKMFDWVVRNIQLDEEVTFTPEQVEELRLAQGPDDAPWFNGLTGLGYHRSLYQLLIYARGDYAERGKLLIEMLDHQGIPAAMLAVEGRPWCVAVRLGDDLFLFDTRLGLPIPGEKIGSVATLSQVRGDAEILEGLDLAISESTTDDSDYWVKTPQLESLEALIYVSPESLSRRMRFLEQRLVGDSRLKLSQNAESLLQAFSGIDGVQPTLWDVEFKHHAFRQIVREALAEAKFEDDVRQKLSWYYDSESYIDGFEAFRTARSMFVNGHFESERNSQDFNAIENFYLLMYSDEQIENLAVDRVTLTRLGILQGAGQNAAEFTNELRGVQASMRLVRRDAGISMAQSHFDNGNLGTAANWLERISSSQDNERWRGATRYLLGRSFESRREYDRAMATYKASELSQRHGNLIRMRYLKELAGESISTEAN